MLAMYTTLAKRELTFKSSDSHNRNRTDGGEVTAIELQAKLFSR